MSNAIEEQTFSTLFFHAGISIWCCHVEKPHKKYFEKINKKSTHFQLEYINWFPIMWNEDRWAHARVRWSMTA